MFYKSIHETSSTTTSLWLTVHSVMQKDYSYVPASVDYKFSVSVIHLIGEEVECTFSAILNGLNYVHA